MRYIIGAMLTSATLGTLATAAQNTETVHGYLRAVNAAAHRVEVTTDQGKEVTLDVGNNARLERDGKQASLDSFRKGMRVKVSYEHRGNKDQVTSMTAAPVSTADVRQQIRDTLRSAKTFTFQQKDEYRKRLEGVMHQADDRIAQLEDQAAQAGAEARKKYDKQIRQLRRLRDRAQTQIERVQSATPQVWDDLRSGVGTALEDLGRAFEQAGKHLR